LPPEAQGAIARTILQITQVDGELEPVVPEHLRAVLEGLAQANRRHFATDEDIEAAFRRFDA
jgi:hypothetical protein